jgi:Tol biopolymer transport system component
MKKLNRYSFLLSLLIFSIANVGYSQMQTPWNFTGGEKIFFSKVTGLTKDLYAMDPDGGNVQKLSNFGQGIQMFSPKISAAGKFLTFLSTYEIWKSRNIQDIFLLDLTTGEFNRISGDEWQGPLPQERATLKVLYQIPTNPLTSYGLISYKGCSQQVSVNYGAEQTFENVPAGVLIWVKAVSGSGVGIIKSVILNPNSVGEVIMDNNDGNTGYSSAYPSPNGSKIAATFLTNSSGYNLNDASDDGTIFNVDILNSDGSVNAALTTYSDDAAFSNDGTKLAFPVNFNTNQVYQSLAYIMSSNYNSTPTVIMQGQVLSADNYAVAYDNPSWSPDGEKIVFQKTLTGYQTGNPIISNICVYDFNTNTSKQLTNYSGKYIAVKPCFSPDGSQVAFVLCTSPENQFTEKDIITGGYSTSIYKIADLTSGKTVALTTDGTSSDPTWGITAGTTPADKTTIIQEGFDNLFPPENWTIKSLNKNNTWYQSNFIDYNFNVIDPNNSYSAICPYDTVAAQDEWLITNQFSLGNGTATLVFYAAYDPAWLAESNLKLQISTNGGSNWTECWSAADDGGVMNWRKITVDLSAYAGNSNLKLGWEYVGNNGNSIGLDGIKLTGVAGALKVNDNKNIPIKFSISQNYPNPFNPTTTINYSIPKPCIVTLKVYDILGREAATLVNEQKNAGNYSVQFAAGSKQLASGIYIYRIQAGNFVDSKKLILMK